MLRRPDSPHPGQGRRGGAGGVGGGVGGRRMEPWCLCSHGVLCSPRRSPLGRQDPVNHEHANTAARRQEGQRVEDGGGDALPEEEREEDDVGDPQVPAARVQSPRPPLYPEGTHKEQLRLADIIKANWAAPEKASTRSTYGGHWRTYDGWHKLKYGLPAPRCPVTGFIWLNRVVATDCVQWMASVGKTSPQVSSPASPYRL